MKKKYYLYLACFLVSCGQPQPVAETADLPSVVDVKNALEEAHYGSAIGGDLSALPAPEKLSLVNGQDPRSVYEDLRSLDDQIPDHLQQMNLRAAAALAEFAANPEPGSIEAIRHVYGKLLYYCRMHAT